MQRQQSDSNRDTHIVGRDHQTSEIGIKNIRDTHYPFGIVGVLKRGAETS